MDGEALRGESAERPRISVITVTNRPGSIDVTWGALKKQKFQDFEWILADELYDWRKEEVKKYTENDPRVKHIKAPKKGQGLWALNRGYNAALQAATGELIVSLQDYIWIRGDGLGRFWDLYKGLPPKSLVTGAGHKTSSPSGVHGKPEERKITIYGSPYTGRPVGTIYEYDERLAGEKALQEINPSWWELNWCMAPRQLFLDLGGFEERHDMDFFGCDNLSIAYRAEQLEYRFYLDKENECIGFPHTKYFPRAEGWEEKHGRHGEFIKWYREWLEADRPQLNYLT